MARCACTASRYLRIVPFDPEESAIPYRSIIRKLEAITPLTEAEKNSADALCSRIGVTPRRSDVVSKGEQPTHVRVILEGWAARYSLQRDGSRRITAFLIPGDFCDIHVTVLAKMDHGITAITDCKVGYVESAAIEAIANSTATLTRAFWRATLVDEAILRRWLVNSGRADAYAAVGHLLCELYERMNLVGLASADTVTIPLTQEEIADATGLTSVHVNRIMRRLREDNLVTLHGGEMRILNADALRRAAEFDDAYLHLRRR